MYFWCSNFVFWLNKILFIDQQESTVDARGAMEGVKENRTTHIVIDLKWPLHFRSKLTMRRELENEDYRFLRYKRSCIETAGYHICC